MKRISIIAAIALCVSCSEAVRYDRYELIDMKTKQSVTVIVPADTDLFQMQGTVCKYKGEIYLR